MLAQTIAHYRIQAKIGAGGMGEVYRATDTKLGRDVALKVLPEAFVHDATRMARFEREARLLAALNHPNIAAIYGLEESNTTHALIMELVEGPTLAERIKQGPLPLDEALPIAKQITEGLEYAHERGIIHRDLKPSNVKLTPDGHVKILDFGLAKALEGETSEEELQNSPTLSAAATRAGVLLGTAAYMSPEQARGKRVDRRADIWAFGCVFYEMLTGQGAFGGETTSDILACVIRAQPDWNSLASSVPSRIRELLRRCLQKDPKQRLRDIGEARIAIEETLSGASQEVGAFPASAVGQPIWRQAVPWAAGILLAIVASATVWELRPRPEAAQVVHFSFGPPTGDSLEFGLYGKTFLAISRDGAQVVFLARHGGTPQLYLRRMDRLESEPLAGTDNANEPFFSPDGKWVGFFADGKLKKVSVVGGTPLTLCDAPNPNGGTWAPDDSIIFAPRTRSGLMRVPAEGGTPQPFTRPDSSQAEKSEIWPQVLPGGKAIIYASSVMNGLQYDWTISATTLKTGEVKPLPIHGWYPRYSPGGYLAFERPEGLFAVPFDLQRLEVKGSPFPVSQVPSFAVSETDSVVYVPGGASNLAWVDRKGVLTQLRAPARRYNPRIQLSPDGKRVVLVIDSDVWVYDIPRATLTRLTFGEGENAHPTLSSDGRRIAFIKIQGGNYSIVAKAVDGTGSEETLLPPQTSMALLPDSWSPDAKFLACSRLVGRNGKTEIWVLPLEGERKPQVFLANQFDNHGPAFSRDGKYLAYVSNETGRNEVYVMPFGNGNGKWQISTGGGNVAGVIPVWERDGKQLFYRESGNIMGVDVKTEPVFTASTPRVIVPAKATTSLGGGADPFDIDPDGQRFLIHQQSSEAAQTAQIHVVLNWSEELRRLSASGKN